MMAMQWTRIETANDEGLLRDGGGSVKRVVIREDLMKDRTPFVKITELSAYTRRRALARYDFGVSDLRKGRAVTLTQLSYSFVDAICRPSELVIADKENAGKWLKREGIDAKNRVYPDTQERRVVYTRSHPDDQSPA